jgi:hypothetical protein
VEAVLIEAFADIIILSFAYGGIHSFERLNPEEEDARLRHPGEALIPFVALDVNAQNVESDVWAWDVRGEIGYACFGFQARRTHYREAEPRDELNAQAFHFLYRMSFGPHVEVDLGFGALELRGNAVNRGFSFTMPVLVYPTENFGIEYRPAWSTIDENRLYDHDLSLVLGFRYGFIRGGYRWFYGDNESLSGPQAGVSLRW